MLRCISTYTFMYLFVCVHVFVCVGVIDRAFGPSGPFYDGYYRDRISFGVFALVVDKRYSYINHPVPSYYSSFLTRLGIPLHLLFFPNAIRTTRDETIFRRIDVLLAYRYVYVRTHVKKLWQCIKIKTTAMLEVFRQYIGDN